MASATCDSDLSDLTERHDFSGTVVEEGVIRGVKILGLESANGRSYSPAGVKAAQSLYEGAKVNVNHAKGPGASRGYEDRIGHLSGVSYREGQGLFGDLNYNPKHRLAEQLAWDAKNSPANVGLSHDVKASTRTAGGKVIVESIQKVNSVDVVADPATTKSLFESTETMSTEITLEAVKARPEIVAALLQEQAQGEAAKAKDAELKRLREENDAFHAAAALATRKAEIEAELKEAKLPEPLVTDVFKQTLLEAKDSAARKVLIEDRQAIAKQVPSVVKPKSREQNASNLTEGYTPSDPKQTAAKLRS